MLTEFRDQHSSKNLKLKTVYNVIRKFETANAEFLIKETGYKPATCARLIDELLKKKLIISSGFGESTGGRKPIMYRINPTASYLIGVEITNLYTTVLLLDLNLGIIGTEKIKIKIFDTVFHKLDLVLERIHTLLKEYQISEKDLLGIGVAADDLFDQLSQVDNPLASQQIKKQLKIDIKEYLSNKIHTCVLLDNGANFAALAEYRNNYWKEANSLLFTTCDMEIRNGLICDDKLLLNSGEITNSFGHMIVDIDGEQCSCGSRGCLHAYSSLPAIKDNIIDMLIKGHSPSMLRELQEIDTIDFYRILHAIEQNDPLCTIAIEKAAYYYGIALSNLIFILKPEVVICGGTLVPKNVFFDIVQKTVLKRLKTSPHLHVQIKPASTSYNIVSQGAGCMVLEYYLQ